MYVPVKYRTSTFFTVRDDFSLFVHFFKVQDKLPRVLDALLTIYELHAALNFTAVHRVNVSVH